MVRPSTAKHLPPRCLTALVTRAGLLDIIERQRHKRLLLIHASAGYGKTVLLAQWRDMVQASGAVSVWVQLEKSDASADRFLASLTSGLAEAGILDTDEPPRGSDDNVSADPLQRFLALAALSTRESWLTLEDWQHAECGAVGELMEALLRNLPANWHVALSGRARPRLNLLMLRARGQLIDLDQHDLRFSVAEAQLLMAPRKLPPGIVEELVELSEGWPIALQLADLWLADDGKVEALRSSFLETIDGMADFVATEVFAALSVELRDFLIESSICTRFNADLVDFIRDRSDSANLIEISRSPNGLTVAIDSQREWYRHHRILAEFLDRERRRSPAKHIASLHGRATLWFERQGLLFEAVDHARKSGDEARTVQLVEDAGCVDICIRTGAPAVRALLDSLPLDVVRQRPRLRAAYTAMNLKLGSIGQAGELLAELQASADAGDGDAGLRRDLLIVQNLRQCFIDENPSADDLVAHRHSLQAFAGGDWWIRALMQNVQGRLEMRRGMLEDAVQSLIDADQLFEAEGSAQGHFFMLANLAICHLFLGRLLSAEEYLGLAQAVLKHQLNDAAIYAGIVHTVEAVLLYERNEVPAAGHAAQLALSGLELAEGCFEQYFSAIQVAARVAFAASGLDAAVRHIERGRRLSRYHALPRMETLLDHLQLRLTIDAEQWDAVARLTELSGLSPPPSSEPGWLEHDLSAPSWCLIALREGRAADARTLAREMGTRCEEGSRLPSQIRANILEALACFALDDWVGARDALRNAIRLASSHGILQPFFEVEGAMLPVLREFQRTEALGLPTTQADFLSGLILRVIAAGKAKAHSEPLTGRESEILELLGHGGSNKVIARQLDLSENAVKFHLKNVFRKLRVDNRAMAAQVARRLDLSLTR
jgi:LuxR family maltose regulon positive regulatory protein